MTDLTTQPNTEPLKVGELKPCPFCGGGAEEWQKYSSYTYDQGPSGRSENCGSWVQVFGCKSCRTEKYSREAWNRRTEPSPAEVSSDGLLESEDIEALIECYATYYSEEWCGTTSELAIHEDERREEAKQILRDYALYQQSTARVKQELTDEKIKEIAAPIIDIRGGSRMDSSDELIEYTVQVVRAALNQRLAVKEGEIVKNAVLAAYEHCAQICKTERDDASPGDSPNASANRAYSIIRALIDHDDALKGYVTHPVSDDQQAKDAARYRWLRDDNAYFPEEMTIRGGTELDALIDAALSTTKQEEV